MKIPILNRISKKVNNFIDSKVELYRGNISPHLAKAIAFLVFFLIAWSLALLSLVFVGLSTIVLLNYLTGELWIGVVSFTGFLCLVTAVIVVFRDKLIILPLYRAFNIILRGKDPLPGKHVVTENEKGRKKVIPKEEKVKEKPLKEPNLEKPKQVKKILKNLQ